jgi:hypothetical protein
MTAAEGDAIGYVPFKNNGPWNYVHVRCRKVHSHNYEIQSLHYYGTAKLSNFSFPSSVRKIKKLEDFYVQVILFWRESLLKRQYS